MLPLTKNRIIYSILGLLLCLVGKDGFGQKEANNWFFGFGQAVNFASGNPVRVTGSNMVADYGSTSLSDSLGNLLFYSDGTELFNRNNFIMPHGDGLLSNGYATSPCVAFRMPGSLRKYYIFTVAGAPSTKWIPCLNYSIIDMSLDGGLGDIVAFQKNIPLLAADSAYETIGAIRHGSKDAYWVFVRNHGTPNKFYTFLVDVTGVNPNPVVSPCFLNFYMPSNGQSEIIKISPDGKYLLYASRNSVTGHYGKVELYRIDNVTGQLSQLLLFDTGTMNMGAEFSANSEYLYMSNNAWSLLLDKYIIKISQYDLKKVNDVTQFQNSAYSMVEDTLDNFYGNLLLANNGKIYFIQPYGSLASPQSFLGVINYPYLPGAACNIQLNYLALANFTMEGLPTFVSSFAALFDWTGNCVADSVSFTSHFYPFPNSFTWSFGDPSSGSADTSYLANPKHIYYSPGVYTVSTTAVFPNGTSETATRQITISTGPSIQIGDSIYKCPNDSVLLSPGNGFDEYLWSNGSHNATMYAKNPGNYWVQARKLGECMSMDSVRVFNYSGIALNNDSLNIAPTTCSGTTGAITGLQVIGSPPLTFQWTASGTPISDTLDLYHLGVGLYELNVTDGYGCKNTVASYTISDAGNILIDTAAATPAFCNKPDGTLTITAVSGLGKMLRYFIKTGSDTLSQWGNGKFTALTSGTYYAWVSDSSAVCRSAYSWPVVVPAISAPAFASVTATAENCGKHDGQIAISMSPGYVPQLQYFLLSGTDTVSQWGNSLFNSLSGGSYRVWASDSSGCTSIYPMLVNVDKLTAPVITSVSTTPENGTASDGTITVVGSGSGLTYSLNGGVPANNGYFTGLAQGSYSVKISNAAGCDTSFFVVVNSVSGIRLTAIAGDGSACLGNVAVLPLLANSFVHVKSFKAQLKYNSALLTCQNHLNVNPALFADSLHVDLFPATGQLSIKWTGKTPVSLQDGSTLVELSFASLNAGQDSLKWDISPGICVFTDSLGNSINRELVQGKVRVYSIPEADVTQPLTTCEGADLQLAANYQTGTGNGTISYLWSGPGGFASDTNSITLTSVTPASAGQYSVSLSDTNQCQNQYSTEVSVIPTPVSGFTNDTLLFDQTYTLEANPGYYRYTWSTTDSTYSITVTAEGWYKVTLTTIGGCTATDSVLMLTAFAPLTMPNAFTPNGDILNDVFKAVTTPEKIRSYTLYIYDRWGKQVYFTNDVTQGWDGTIDGTAAPVGNYVYYVKYSNTSDAVREKRGMVVLVR